MMFTEESILFLRCPFNTSTYDVYRRQHLVSTLSFQYIFISCLQKKASFFYVVRSIHPHMMFTEESILFLRCPFNTSTYDVYRRKHLVSTLSVQYIHI